MENTETHFHSFFIKGVTSVTTGLNGWRIVGLWGEEKKGEGNRIGPYFDEEKIEDCEALIDRIEKEFTLPVEISKVVKFLSQSQLNN